jgi:penicillin-binding protein 2
LATSDPSPALRLTFLTVIVVGLFLALFSRLWFLQVLAGDRYVELADTNRLRTVVTEAPRGRILDAEGQELVKNRPALTISAERQLLLDGNGDPRGEEAERVLDRLSELLQLERDEIIERLTSRRYSPFRAIPVAFDVAPEIVFTVREHQELFPGVVAEMLPVRTYPHGTLAAHMVGYLGEISEEELAAPEFADYRGGDLIGRGGLEEVYEPDLRGVEGQRILEVTAQNAVVEVISEREPQQGNDLVTTLDLDLQQAVERLLEDGILASRDEIHTASGRNLPSTGGSAIVLDPRDGSILAMASYPTFDPREFVGGVTQTYWAEITDPENFTPLFNRPIQAAHPPGSVFKTVTGAAYMEAGLVGPQSPLPCPSSWDLGGITFNNWNRANEGAMALSTALMRSCDTYFYELAYRQWQREQAQGGAEAEILPTVAAKWGFGRQLGIDLPSERAGTIPGREWRREYWERNRDAYCRNAEELPSGTYGQQVNADLCQFGGLWRGGDAVNTSIGQGDVLTTPMQVAASYMAVANGGTVYRPHVGRAILDLDGQVVREIEPEVVSELGLDSTELAAIQDGLRRVVMEERGTARGAFTRGTPFPLDEIPVAGKTGTAELKPKVPFAWFAAYAPADDPEYVVVVNVEEGGGGSQTAAPIARNILEHLFGIVAADDAEFEAGDAIYD